MRTIDAEEASAATAELDTLGYGALWVPGGDFASLEERLRLLLDASRRIVVATSIVSIWTHPPDQLAEVHARVAREHPGRFLLVLGVSHDRMVARTGQQYGKPLTKMREYLDALDAARIPVSPQERAIGALGPKMLELARERTRGAHPFLVTPAHTRRARETLGEQPLLAPEQRVVLGTDASVARAIARDAVAVHLGLPNYTDNLRTLGFEQSDIDDGGSDRLIDELVAWGTPEAVFDRAERHLDAGADHVALEVTTADNSVLPRAEWRSLAALLAPAQA